MKRALLIIGLILGFFVGCKKDDVLEASRVEMNGVDIKIGWDYMKMSGEYSYPLALEFMKLYLSEKEDLSAAKVYECTLDDEAFSVDVKDLKDGVTYYYCYEYDNGYTQVKSEKESFKTVGKPIVVTKDVGGITKSSAVLSGSVTNNDAANKIKERGFCWGKNPNPTISGSHNNNGSSSGTGTTGFSYNLTNLTSGTKYYVRTYIVTDFGVLYGNEKSFVTTGEQPEEPEIVLPAVTTNSVTNITSNSATCGGNVASDGNGTVTARGVCWSTSQTPTINDFRTANGTGTGTFTSNITGLNPNTKYYVRAYATNEAGTSYGVQKSFTTLGEEPETTVQLASVSTNNITDITSSTATAGGNITSDGGGTVSARGVCWSTSQNPTINNNRTLDGVGTGSFTSTLNNLLPQTTYYVRAYVTNEAGTSYGYQKSFTTLEEQGTGDENEETISGTENGHDYVDLGLPSGLKWATCNVGASSPEEYGGYYAWGETTTKIEYTEENCLTSGKQMNDISGNAQYDAATANWGGNWRMPKSTELEELIENCTWTWITQNGVDGYKVEGPNGNSIFLPEAGSRSGLSFNGNQTDYWSSTPIEDNNYRAYILNCYQDLDDYGFRNIGRSVRPVFGGNFTEPEEQPGTGDENFGTNQTFNVNGVSFTMIAVEGGTFSMGATSEQGSDAYNSEKPAHNVTLSDYYIGETEVAQELWEAVMGSNPSYFSGYPQRPVEYVSWNDCQEFITKLNNLTGKNFRLPTEAEWEYAARGGNKSNGYKYSGSNTIDNVAWYDSNSSSSTHDVKTKQANELGIYDMSGNVYEWCQDWYDSNYYSSSPVTNPTGPSSGSIRVDRGGCWFSSAEYCRVSYRFYGPDFGAYNLGLRLSLSQD